MIGVIIANSGFEDIVYEGGIGTSGSLLGIMAGSQYNRAWLLHSVVSEGLERLLIQRFIGETKLQPPSDLTDIISNPDSFTDTIKSCSTFISQYEAFMAKLRSGSLSWKDATVLDDIP